MGWSEVDGLLAFVVLDQGVSSMGQQDLDDRESSSLAGHHQGGPSSVILVIKITSQTNQTINDRDVTVPASLHHGCGSITVLVVDVGPVDHQSVHDPKVSFHRGRDNRRFSALVDRVDDGSCCQKSISNIFMALLTGHHQGCVPFPILELCVGPKIQESFSDIHSSCLSRDEQRRSTPSSPMVVVDVCPRLDQSLNHVLPALISSHLDWKHGDS